MKRLLRNLICALLRALPVTWWLLRHKRGSVVLCYHRVNDDRDPRRPALSPRVFAKHLAYLDRHFQLRSALEVARTPGAAERRAAITFDDGYPDNVAAALPCLRDAGVPATLFLVTAARIPWTERVHRIHGIAPEAVKRRLKELDPAARDAEIGRLEKVHGRDDEGEVLLSPADLGPWRGAGHHVGAHTRNHPILPLCGDEEIEREVGGSRSDLEAALQEAPALFAYPGGAFDDRVAARVEAAGFEAAFATGGGWVDASSPRYALPRIDVRPDATVSVLAAEIAGILPALRRLGGRR